MNKIRGAWLLFGLVAVAVLALGGFAQAPPASAAVNSVSILPVSQTVAPGATEITISLELDVSAPGIGGWDIDVVYDDTLLRATACSPTAGGLCSVLAGPAVNFGGKSFAGLTGSPLQLGTITFQADATNGISFIEAIVTGLIDPDGADIIFAPPTDGAVIVGQPILKQGDVDCNNAANSVDALLVLRFSAGLGVNQNEPCPDTGTVPTGAGLFGDVDCSGAVNSVDALKILRFAAGLGVSQNEPPPCVDLGQLLEFVDARIVGNVLQVEGTSGDDNLVLRLNAGNGDLEIDVADDGIADFSFDQALFTEINVDARDGTDLVRVDEANGPIVEPTSIIGGGGDDTMLGGSAIETIDGGTGDDFVDGGPGNDVAFLGAGNDNFRWDPGDASDVVLGGDGTDALTFNGANGDDTVDLSANGELFTFFRQPGNITMDVDEVETFVFNALGGADTVAVNDLTGTDVAQVDLNLDAGLGSGTGDGMPDQVTVNGTAGEDVVVAVGNAGTVNVFNFTTLTAAVAIRQAEAANDLLAVNVLGGDDIVEASALPADAIKLAMDGGAGVDLLVGGGGDDFIDGGQASDEAFMGTGDDVFLWNPGDGSDVVEGEGGADTLLFNGADIDENIDLSANGERFTFFRQPGNITMDGNGVETSVINALGGADTVAVNDLTGTDVADVNLNLDAGLGAGDGLADEVTVNGTAFNDLVFVTGSAGNVNVTGLSAKVAITAAEPANDVLTVSALGLNDGVDASGLQADVVKQLKIDGGAGEDFILGSHGADELTGGGGADFIDGNQGVDTAFMDAAAGEDFILGSHGADELTGGGGADFIDGNQGVDTAFMDAGNDIFRWDPGDGSDVVEGGADSDTLLFNGSAGGETVDLSANGERFTFFRQPGNITMDTNEVESSIFNALGGQDTITVNDLALTDVKQVVLNLAAGLENNASDGLQDQVTVNGTAGNDAIVVTGSAGNVDVTGLAADVAITLADPIDRLDINTAAGNDTVDTTGLAAGVIQLLVDGVPV